jgi:hypothetical protein
MLISYYNDKILKEKIVKEMKLHKEQDRFIKGHYSKNNGDFRGCAVGCAIDSINKVLNKKYFYNDHSKFEDAIGVPEWLAKLSDTLFEGLPDGKNSQFAVDFLETIPVGVDLTPVKWKFCAFLLKKNIERVLVLDISDELKKQVINAIQGVLVLHETATKTGIWDASAAASAASAAWSAAKSAAKSVAESVTESVTESAWSAAESAAESVAASAARSAAESTWNAANAAWYAARSAARSAAASAASTAASVTESAAASTWSAWNAAASAAYKEYAKYLLEILRETK